MTKYKINFSNQTNYTDIIKKHNKRLDIGRVVD